MNTVPAPLGQAKRRAVSQGLAAWRRLVPDSRYGLAGLWLLSVLVASMVLRLVLFFRFGPDSVPLGELTAMFVNGLQRDLCASLLLTLPMLTWLLCLPNSAFGARWHRVFFTASVFVTAFGQLFLFCIEYYFFDEFKARFNTVAVDYLLYPHEVTTNIWQSYPVTWVVLACLLAALVWLVACRRLLPTLFSEPIRLRTRLALFLGALVLTVGLSLTFDLKRVDVSRDRIVNELANNGTLSFFAAAWTRHLDYTAFYRTLPRPEAYARARTLLSQPGATFVNEGESILRAVAGDPSKPKLNVLILLEESLGSEFWGCLGRKETLTPQMDLLATGEGLLFTNIYACGTRTVRGMEGVLSSFPPLPGDSIVKRDRSENVETLARVLKRDGYSTLFLYGGGGHFDGMRSYAVRNGYDRFIEEEHFTQPTFKTAWGVCDEDLLDRTLTECRILAGEGKPFFVTALTVSNHRPYTYPAGRIPEDPNKQWRRNAVKYADFALGRFFSAARNENFWTNTIFVVVADHGARVYGRQSIPIHSYEIPLVILGPAVVDGPARIPTLGSSLDVAPTILGLIGRPYETLFFGRDLLKADSGQARAFLNHNRDIGMLAKDRLVVLGMLQRVEFYTGNPKRVEMQLLAAPAASDLELEKDTSAIYQVADHLYTHRLYRIDDTPPPAMLTTRQGVKGLAHSKSLSR